MISDVCALTLCKQSLGMNSCSDSPMDTSALRHATSHLIAEIMTVLQNIRCATTNEICYANHRLQAATRWGPRVELLQNT